MATVHPLRQIKFGGTISGNAPQARVYGPASGATIHAGDVVVSSAGLAAVSATTVPASNTVLGVALHGTKQGTAWYLVPEDGSGTLQQEDTGGTFGGTFMGGSNLLGSQEGTGVHVVIANSDNLFQVVLKESISYDRLGVQVGIVQDATTGVWYADTTSSTKSAFIVDIVNLTGQVDTAGVFNPIPNTSGGGGDTYWPVLVSWMEAAMILAGQ